MGKDSKGSHSTASASLFRVGDNVDFTMVVAMISALVFHVMIFEHLVHKLDHRLKQYPKYHEMMTKIFGELMILGLIGLGIKILKELGQLDPYTPTMIAFQVADITVFIVAIGLIIQGVVACLRLSRKNIQFEKAELVGARNLVDYIEALGNGVDSVPNRLIRIFRDWCARKKHTKALTPSDVPDIVSIRLLRHLFIKIHGLPELFPFSKYLRQAQDNAVTQLIEVKLSTWAILLVVAWWIDGFSETMQRALHMEERFSLMAVYVGFSWLFVLKQWAVCANFSWAVGCLHSHFASTTNDGDCYALLRGIVGEENSVMNNEQLPDAIATMERVRDRLKQQNHTGSFEAIWASVRSVVSQANATLSSRQDRQSESNQSHRTRVEIRYFSRRVWHAIIGFLMMLNAFFFALFCQCALYQHGLVYREAGLLMTILVPLPLVLNALVLQPQLLRDFVLLSTVVSVDRVALSDVIDHLTETSQLCRELLQTIHQYLLTHNRSIQDIKEAFESEDPTRTGVLDVNAVRLVLRRFGLNTSFFRFNSLARLLFEVETMSVRYEDVVRLLRVDPTDDPEQVSLRLL